MKKGYIAFAALCAAALASCTCPSAGEQRLRPSEYDFFGSPLFDKAEVRVRDGVLTVTAHNNSAANKYIQAVKLNGKPYTKPYIAFDDIAAGGVLEFEMGAEPAVWYEL